MSDGQTEPRNGPSSQAGFGPVSDQYRFPATSLRADHFRVYQAARTHLKALAMSTPATSPVDYWDVLQRIDGLHDPFARMPVQQNTTNSRGEMYSAARTAIEALAQFGLDACGLAAAVTSLDECWAADRDHGSTVSVDGGAR